LLDIATWLWADETTLTACVNANTFDSKITNQMSLWTELFNVTWTPWNVLINTETLEYDILSWAYPVSSFENIIDRLLAE
jgi:hypothetical protein